MTWMISAIEQVVVREERLRADTKVKKQLVFKEGEGLKSFTAQIERWAEEVVYTYKRRTLCVRVCIRDGSPAPRDTTARLINPSAS